MERSHINPKGVYRHPAFTRVVTVSGPAKFVFIAGQTPSDENYKCVAPGDYRGQYLHVLNLLTVQLDAAGATWDDVVFKRTFARDVDELNKVTRNPATPVPWNRERPPPSTLIGVTRLSYPEFLLEIDLMAVVGD
jgi:enamine deaminase RidA (YjgF/YER057c/UK114 family)